MDRFERVAWRILRAWFVVGTVLVVANIILGLCGVWEGGAR